MTTLEHPDQVFENLIAVVRATVLAGCELENHRRKKKNLGKFSENSRKILGKFSDPGSGPDLSLVQTGTSP